MRLKEQIVLFVMGSLILLTMSLMLVFYFQVKSTAYMAAETKVKSDLATAEEIINLKYPGAWRIKDGELYKGQFKMSGNFFIVDYIEKLTGDSCTIFMNNTRVATTVRDINGNRAVGTQASEEVINTVLGAGQEFVGSTKVVGKKYQTAYKPITDEQGKIIGMLYVGAPEKFYYDILYGSLKMMGIASLLLTLLIGLVTRYFITRNLVKPLQVVIEGTRDVAVRGKGEPLPVIGSNEIGELTCAFNQMVEEIHKIYNSLSLPKTESQPGKPQEKEDLLQNERRQKQLNELERMTGTGSLEAEDCEWLEKLLYNQKELPKGLNRLTLKQVTLFLKQRNGSDVTIQDIADAIDLSKVTLRRYLDYLEECGLVDVEQKYGSVGRPLRIYRLKENLSSLNLSSPD